MDLRTVEAVVVEYRSPDRTVLCVSSLLEQGVRCVVIVDNSDDAGTTHTILAARYACERRVCILDSGQNLGFAKAVNLGLTRCKGNRVLLINNDALLEDNALDLMRVALSENVDCVLAVPSLMHAGKPLGRIYYHRWTLALTSRRWPGAFEVPRGACMLLALERWPSIPLFDERFFMYGEELELGWRLATSGKSIAYAKEANVTHLGSGAAGIGSPFYEERTALAHLLMNSIISPRERANPLIAMRRFALLIRALARAFRGRNLVPLRAYNAALRSVRGAVIGLSPPPL